MDAIKNPFAPGAGTQPPELAGRDQILEDARVALGRIKEGRPARSQMLLGLRGVGKTVLLRRIGEMADGQGYETIVLEAPEDKALAEMLVPPMRSMLYRLSRMERSKERAKRGLAVLKSFASAFKVSIGDIEFGVQAEEGTADSGSLDFDLPELFLIVASAAKAAGMPIALIVDEVQYLSSKDLSAIITAIHRVGQDGLPFVLFGAGLPQLAALAGEAKSYAERLFSYPSVGRLADDAARDAIRSPVEQAEVRIEDDALTMIVEKTQGYPYFLQEWGSHTWNVADRSPIKAEDVARATAVAVDHLDASFFRVRLDRLTAREKDYVRAMAELGPGPHRSGEIADRLGIKVMAAGPLRDVLIKKGMIYSPQYGDNAFTVPMFDEFMRRSMPDWTPSTAQSTGKKRRRK